MDAWNIVGLCISIVGVVISISFALAAKKDANRAQSTLDSVNKAIDGWQKDVMKSTTSILDSQPQVIEAKMTLAKIEAAQKLINGLEVTIKEMSANPQPGAAGHTQNEILQTLTFQLERTLNSINQNQTQKPE